MALKTFLKEHEKYGLSEEEAKLATKWLRKFKTASILGDLDAAKLFELFLLGEPISKLATQYSQFPIGQIALTAALRGWFHDRDKMMGTLQDRVRAKVVKSVLDQVDFLTAMMSVANAEHLEAMNKYCKDPVKNPKPSLRIESIKDYKEVTETLFKIVSGATAETSTDNSGKKKSPMLAALIPKPPKILSAKNLAATEEVEISLMDVEAGIN